MADKNRIIAYIQNEFAKYSRENTTLDSYIPNIQVDTGVGAIPIDKTGTHLNLENMYSGKSFYHLNNDSVALDDTVYRARTYDFFFGISKTRMQSLNDIFRDGNRAGEMILNDVMQDLKERDKLIKDKELFDVATDNASYSASNIVDLKTTPIANWTETDAEKLIDAITALLSNFNRAIGGGLLDEKGNLKQGSSYKPLLIIPNNIWQKFSSKLKIFTPYISYGGSNTEFRTMQVGMFEAITGCDVLITSSVQLIDTKINEISYDNVEYVWNKPAIYLLTLSNSLLDMSGIKRLVVGSPEFYTKEDLGDLMFRAISRSITLVQNKFANGRIELNGYV